jgi:hypothetical protein
MSSIRDVLPVTCAQMRFIGILEFDEAKVDGTKTIVGFCVCHQRCECCTRGELDTHLGNMRLCVMQAATAKLHCEARARCSTPGLQRKAGSCGPSVIGTLVMRLLCNVVQRLSEDLECSRVARAIEAASACVRACVPVRVCVCDDGSQRARRRQLRDLELLGSMSVHSSFQSIRKARPNGASAQCGWWWRAAPRTSYLSSCVRATLLLVRVQGAGSTKHQTDLLLAQHPAHTAFFRHTGSCRWVLVVHELHKGVHQPDTRLLRKSQVASRKFASTAKQPSNPANKPATPAKQALESPSKATSSNRSYGCMWEQHLQQTSTPGVAQELGLVIL